MAPPQSPLVSIGREIADETVAVAEAPTPIKASVPQTPPFVMRASDETSRLELIKTHQALVSELLEEEESIIEAHRSQIDESMRLVKEVSVLNA